MQPYLQGNTRDFSLTPSGDLVMTEEDKIQNCTGNFLVEKGDDIFDNDFGINWEYVNSIGNDSLAQSYILSEINKKFLEEKLLVTSLFIEKTGVGMYSVKASYNQDQEEKQLELTLNQF